MVSETNVDLLFYLQSEIQENPYNTGFFTDEITQARRLHSAGPLRNAREVLALTLLLLPSVRL